MFAFGSLYAVGFTGRLLGRETLGPAKGRPTNNFQICVACLKPSRLGMFAADMPSLEGLRHATLAETRKLFIVRS